jgi:MYND finger
MEDHDYWSIFYEFYLSKTLVKLIRNHASKLVSVSKNLEAWMRSSYGTIVSMVNTETLKALRQCWFQYFDPETSGHDRRSSFHDSAAQAGKRRNQTHNQALIARLTTLFGPLVEKSMVAATLHANLTCDFGCTCKDIPETEFLNPLFAFSVGSGNTFSINSHSSPLMGFHLAASLAPQASDSIRALLNRTDNDIIKVKLAACLELKEWLNSFKKFATSSRLRLRFFVGEATALCYALDQLGTGIASNMLSTYLQPWSGTTLVLDGSHYVDTPTAPLTFNVVDGSNLIDTIGGLNMLVSVIPVLERSPATILHTDITFCPEKGQTETALLSRLLHANVQTVCALLGVAPLSLMTGLTTRGHQHHLLLPPNRHYHRISWKLASSGDMAAGPSTKLACTPDDLGAVLGEMFFNMYPHEGEGCNFKTPLDPPEPGFGRLVNPPHYTKRGFAALMAFLKPRILVDWDAVMVQFFEIISDRFLEGVHIFHLQDQLLQLYLAGTDPHIRRFNVEMDTRPVHNVIPSSAVCCIVLSVPRKAFQRVLQQYPRVEAELNHRINLSLRIRLMTGRPENDEKFTDRLNKVQLYTSTIPIFGKLVPSPDGRSCTIEPDPKGWNGSSDLQACTYVPTRSLETMREGPHPQIDLQVNPDYGAVGALGGLYSLNLHSAPLFDTNQVTLVDALPGLEAPKPTLLASPRAEWPLHIDSVTTPVLNSSNLMFTSRLTVRQEVNKAMLASGAPIAVADSTPCTVNISCQNYQYRFVFPYPVIAMQSKIQVNRKSGWIQITVPLASNKEGGYLMNPFPVLRQSGITCNWNLPKVTFKTLPKIDISNREVNSWVIKHLDTMFSKSERQNSQLNHPALPRFKESIYDIIVGLTRSPVNMHVIKANAGDTGCIALFASGLYINDTTHSIVAQAYVHPYVHATDTPETPNFANGINNLVVGKEAFELWKQALPAMVESCRDWEHKADCSMASDRLPRIGAEEGESPLCSCCVGGSRQGTPLSLFPVFGIPYLEESSQDRDGLESIGNAVADLEISQTSDRRRSRQNENGQSNSCNRCRKGATKKCGNCNVKYCSRECQRQDWKEHKNYCAK